MSKLEQLAGKEDREYSPRMLPDHARIVAGKPTSGPEEDECPGPVDCREWTPEDEERRHWQQVCYVNPWNSKQSITCWVHREFLSRASQQRYQTLTHPGAWLNDVKARADVVRQFKDGQ
jgi:hypothetical protein